MQAVNCGVSEDVKFSVKCGDRVVTYWATSILTVVVYATFPYVTSYCVSVRQFALHERAIDKRIRRRSCYLLIIWPFNVLQIEKYLRAWNLNCNLSSNR
jgi:hypothetical protein